jgi:hypothetical protein
MSNILTGNIAEMGIVTFTYDPASQATIDTDEDTVTVTGLRVGDFVIVNKPTHTDGVGLTDARVTAADTLSVTWVNPTAGAVDPASETYTLLWFRPDSTRNSVQP